MSETTPAKTALIPVSEWHTHVVCTAQWTLGAPIGRGESQPRHATRQDGLKGVAKPAIQSGGGTPRAAHEKIAADLAHYLGFPVPAVLLWTDPSTSELYSISSWACRQPEIWQNQKGSLTPLFIQNCAQMVADITIFHSWIGDTDRNEGNTLVDLESSETAPKLFFIDHAFCFGHNPRFDGHSPTWAPHNYYPGHHMGKAQHMTAIGLIERLTGDLITSIVTRVPPAFLSQARRDVIVRELTRRQGILRRDLGA